MYPQVLDQAKPAPCNQAAATNIPMSYSNTTTPYFSTDSNYQPPPPPPPQPRSHVEWSTGLCDCFSDLQNCCMTFWCPCVTFGRVAEIVDKGSTSCGASGALYTLISCLSSCACLYSCFYRTKMRRQYMLKESPCCDCLVHCFCETCALCQEYRELKNRGFDMVAGWNGNVELSQGVGMTQTTPAYDEHMTR